MDWPQEILFILTGKSYGPMVNISQWASTHLQRLTRLLREILDCWLCRVNCPTAWNWQCEPPFTWTWDRLFVAPSSEASGESTIWPQIFLNAWITEIRTVDKHRAQQSWCEWLLDRVTCVLHALNGMGVHVLNPEKNRQSTVQYCNTRSCLNKQSLSCFW